MSARYDHFLVCVIILLLAGSTKKKVSYKLQLCNLSTMTHRVAGIKETTEVCT